MAESFGWIAAPDAQALVLGSFPSQQSLQIGEYYAHPRNAFWPIMLAIAGKPLEPMPAFADRRRMLEEAGIALWDVFRECRRPGSLDSSIDLETARINDFSALLGACPGIRRVFFNGQSPRNLYRKALARQNAADALAGLESQALPSTSPAYAAIAFRDKLAAWRVLEKHSRLAPAPS